nr:hypothetical protein [Agrobacterium sp. rho-13.3]
MMSVSKSTEELYGSHARRFLRWHEERGSDVSDPKRWVDALQELTVGLSKKTWRLYRNAVTWYLRETYGGVFAGTFLTATDIVEKPQTKSKKLLRHIEPLVLKEVVAALLKRTDENAHRLADLMIAMVATGLRQKEFGAAQLVARKGWVLVVENAKYRQASEGVPGRGNGPVRELHIDDSSSPALLATIERTLVWCRGREWRKTHGPNVNRIFRQVVDDLVRRRKIGSKWKRLRIYDCRHQFSANAKEHLDLMAGEVAAAMGHRSVVTAVSHYGKRSYARSGAVMVRPSSSSLAAVSEASKTKARSLVQRSELARASRSPDGQARPGTARQQDDMGIEPPTVPLREPGRDR